MSRCKACDKLMSDNELMIDEELCSKCLDSVNEEFIEDSFQEAYEKRNRRKLAKKKYGQDKI